MLAAAASVPRKQSGSRELTFAEQDQHQSRKRVPQEGAVHDGVGIDFFSLSLCLCLLLLPCLISATERNASVFLVHGTAAGDLKKQQQQNTTTAKRLSGEWTSGAVSPGGGGERGGRGDGGEPLYVAGRRHQSRCPLFPLVSVR